MKVNVPKIHESFLQFLLEKRKKNPNLTFTLRNDNTRTRLDKGYWFDGTEKYLELSFWTGYDWKSKSFSIGFYADFTGYDCVLSFSALDSEPKAGFLKKLSASIPGMRQLKQKGKPLNCWEKHYYGRSTDDYIASLQKFFQQDKPLIDNFIAYAIELDDDRLNDIGFISEAHFQNMLSEIQIKRKWFLEAEKREEKKINKIILKKLTLQNIACFSEVSIDFDERITCLIGENGTGKTSVLRAIAIAIAGTDETDLIDTDSDKIKSLLRIIGQKGADAKFADKGDIELSYETDKMYHNNIVFEDKGLKGVNIADGAESAFAATDGELLKCLVLAFPQNQDKTQEPIYLRRIDEPNLGDLLPVIYGTPDERLELFSDWILRLYNIYTDNFAKGKKTDELKLIKEIFQIISEITGDNVRFKTINVEENSIWITTKDAPIGIMLNLVSEGYQNIIGWVGYFMMRLQKANPSMTNFREANAILIMDEIDTYLHPKWQANIVNVLLKYFPNTQFIITSHSPLVMSSLKREQIYIFETQNNNVRAFHPPTSPYGASVDDILKVMIKGT